MEYIAFDIETIPQDFEAFSASQQEYLLRGATNEQEIEKKKGEMALTALTGHVVCIGLARYEMDTKTGEGVLKNKLAISMRSKNDSENDIKESLNEGKESLDESPDSPSKPKDSNEITLSDGTPCLLYNEEDLLKTFWKILDKYKDASLISFNGRNFDAPYLMHRSAVYKIRPSRNLMEGTKFNYPKHVDLIDELTFFSPSSSGPTRRFNFDFYSRAFGIHSPKSEGVDGSHVSVLFAEGKVKEIAEYCLRDVVATWELFDFWNKYLHFKK